jgi:RimJ/RimL family protein N-acetyltransferase
VGTETSLRSINEIHRSVGTGSILKWGIARREDDHLIGTVTLFNIDQNNGRAELGYVLGRVFWGQGYMHEALQMLLAHVYNVLELRRLEADVDPRNKASIRTLERLGFQREGFLRERWHVAGEIQDAYFYGLLRREWKDINLSTFC